MTLSRNPDQLVFDFCVVRRFVPWGSFVRSKILNSVQVDDSITGFRFNDIMAPASQQDLIPVDFLFSSENTFTPQSGHSSQKTPVFCLRVGHAGE